MHLPNEAGRTGPVEIWPEDPNYRVAWEKEGVLMGEPDQQPQSYLPLRMAVLLLTPPPSVSCKAS